MDSLDLIVLGLFILGKVMIIVGAKIKIKNEQ